MPIRKSSNFSKAIETPKEIFVVKLFTDDARVNNYLINYNKVKYCTKDTSAVSKIYDDNNYVVKRTLNFNDTVRNLDKIDGKLFTLIGEVYGIIAWDVIYKLEELEKENKNLKNLNFRWIFWNFMQGRLDNVCITTSCIKVYLDYIFDNILINENKDDYLKPFEPLFEFVNNYSNYENYLLEEIKKYNKLLTIPNKISNNFILSYIKEENRFFISTFDDDLKSNCPVNNYYVYPAYPLTFVNPSEIFIKATEGIEFVTTLEFIERCIKSINKFIKDVDSKYKKIFNYLFKEIESYDGLSENEKDLLILINHYFRECKSNKTESMRRLLRNLVKLFKLKISQLENIVNYDSINLNKALDIMYLFINYAKVEKYVFSKELYIKDKGIDYYNKYKKIVDNDDGKRVYPLSDGESAELDNGELVDIKWCRLVE